MHRKLDILNGGLASEAPSFRGDCNGAEGSGGVIRALPLGRSAVTPFKPRVDIPRA